MLIYTIMPMKEIFPDKSEKQKTFKAISGGLLEVDKQNKITRIISTDPKNYLRYELGELSENS